MYVCAHVCERVRVCVRACLCECACTCVHPHRGPCARKEQLDMLLLQVRTRSGYVDLDALEVVLVRTRDLTQALGQAQRHRRALRGRGRPGRRQEPGGGAAPRAARAHTSPE